ncbi:hypothetical protein GSF08_11115 [Clostridiaceae bacterium DONG20-135]|uniref:Uncharacterized protein n=1 Tax=Copranaerobaculum intestinale TaxID=2692629 RepID=A0A6N8U8E8_9FIRM|nr:hypothetical protein [Copranaerobaculum intestinale]MXQ74476.1 hypothetical protein [Copranaerobaculum intestinale]
MKYQLYAVKDTFQEIMQDREELFYELLSLCDEQQLDVMLERFDAQAIYKGCISLLEDDTLDLQNNDITMYRPFHDEFFHMRVFDHVIELNDYESSPFYHYLMRLHREYVIVDEFAHVHYQKYCKNM